VNVFHDQYTVGQRQSVKTLFSIADKSKTPMISLGLISRAPDGRFIVDRDSDECLAQLDSVAKLISRLETTVLVRPLYEENGNWMGYGSHVNPPDDLISMFQKV